jgi:hypothetical protein
MHILVLLEASFLNINNNSKKQSPLQLTVNALRTGKFWEMVLLALLDMAMASSGKTTEHFPFLWNFPFKNMGA